MSTTTNGGSISSTTWTTDELMHGKVGVPSPPVSPGGTMGSSANSNGEKQKSHHRFSMRKMGHGKKGPPADPMDWGMPGHLTEEEVAVFVSRYLNICVSMFCSCIYFVCELCWNYNIGEFTNLWWIRECLVLFISKNGYHKYGTQKRHCFFPRLQASVWFHLIC